MRRGGGSQYGGVSASPEGPLSSGHETSTLQISTSPAVGEYINYP